MARTTVRPPGIVAAYTRLARNVTRSLSSLHSVNISSSWSTTRTNRCPAGLSPRASATARSSVRSSVAMASRVFCIASPVTFASWAASPASGRSPGVIRRIVHSALSGSAPARRAGIRPALTTEVLPLPEGATTATKRVPRSCSQRRRVSSSRPKNKAACCSRKGSSPRYGQDVPSERRGVRPRGTPVMAVRSGSNPLPLPSPGRRSTQVRVLKNASVGSSGLGAPANRTMNSRNRGSFAARACATASSSRAQSPRPSRPMSTAHAVACRIASRISSCHRRPGVAAQRSKKTVRPSALRRCAIRSIVEDSRRLYERKTS